MAKRTIATLFEENYESDGEGDDSRIFHVNKNYATAYDKWRQKEEMQKLKDRYGDVSLAEGGGNDESSSEESDPFEGFTPNEEKDFFKKLAIVKSGGYYHGSPQEDDDDGDPSSSVLPSSVKGKGKRKEQMYLKDYERRLVLERQGRLSDDDEETDNHSNNAHSTQNRKFKTYTQEQDEIKQSLKAALAGDDDEEEGLLRPRKKTTDEEAKEEEDYLQWLKGQKELVANEKVVSELKPLRDYWSDPNLGEGERFLRDYLLNRRYLENENDDDERIPSYDEVVGERELTLEDDEDELNRQEEFEHKYNFRYEEPDAEFIKTFPRTIGDSLRRTDDKRKQQRDDYKRRKEEEKRKKVEEVKHLKNLKRQEIMDKLTRLRRTAGTDQLPVDLKELDDDFDPAEYDRMMQAAFGDDYYATHDAAEEKPHFSEDEDEMENDDGEEPGELANWDEWQGTSADGGEARTDAGHSSDGPGPSGIPSGSEDTVGKRKRKRSALSEALMRKKPTFNPVEKKFEQYFDEYYKLDFEDIIADDVRCRFKYRQVLPNDFGLSVDEILTAKDKELNSWVSVKKMSQYRSKDEESYDQNAYKTKSSDVKKKQRLLQSVYGEKDTETYEKGEKTNTAPLQSTSAEPVLNSEGPKATGKKKRKKNKKKKKKTAASTVMANQTQSAKITKPAGKPARRADNWERKTNLVERLTDERLAAYGVNPKKVKNRVKYLGGRYDH